MDEDRVVGVLNQTRPDVVFHTVSPRFGLGSDIHHRVNVDGTRSLLSACQKANVTKFIYTSSTMVAFTGLNLDGVAEDDVKIPERSADAYHHTKAIGERLVLEYNGINGLLTTVLRPCGMIGERDRQLIWRLAKSLNDGHDNIQIGDNTNLVDYLYVGNAASAHLLAADCLFNHPEKVAGEVFFITNGSPLPQWDFNRMVYRELGSDGKRKIIKIPFIVALIMAFFVEIFCKITGRTSEFNRFAVRYLTGAQWYNIGKARTRLDYEPQISLEDGVKQTVKWWKDKGEEQFRKRLESKKTR